MRRCTSRRQCLTRPLSSADRSRRWNIMTDAEKYSLCVNANLGLSVPLRPDICLGDRYICHPCYVDGLFENCRVVERAKNIVLPEHRTECMKPTWWSAICDIFIFSVISCICLLLLLVY
uniref:ORFx n=2 Tax=anatid alphaherpesvirus 1 TaxID=104388 RepID=E7D253_9ALPH|nr:ORFx [Anatid alphaherpesvirus 1]